MLGFARMTIACTLWLGAAVASAQTAPADLPAPSEPPAPDAGEPPGDAPSEPAPGTSAGEQPPPSTAPPPAQPPPQPPPEPAPRYDGQVAGDASAADYETDPSLEDPAPEGSHDSGFRGFSIRMDPLNWLLEGRLGFELEVGIWNFITAELVPVLVVNEKPPSFDFSGRDDPISQHSNGLGVLAGASISAGFWLSGEPFSGYVLRLILTNHAFTYEASDRRGKFDEVDFTERRLLVFFGSYSRFGFFTIGGGLGLGYELNQQERCFFEDRAGELMVRTTRCDDEQQILLNRDGTSFSDINGVLHPIYFEGRFSLGVAFD